MVLQVSCSLGISTRTPKPESEGRSGKRTAMPMAKAALPKQQSSKRTAAPASHKRNQTNLIPAQPFNLTWNPKAGSAKARLISKWRLGGSIFVVCSGVRVETGKPLRVYQSKEALRACLLKGKQRKSHYLKGAVV